MSVSVSSPEDIVNLALERIGYPKRIGSMYEGSLPARSALTIYAQTRDQLLRSENWGFARKTAVIVTSGQAPPPPWAYSYAYPADALRILDLIIAGPDLNNPLPVRWAIYSDTVNGKVILAAVAYQNVVYTQKATNVTYWESAFVEALAAALGRRLAPVLMKDSTKTAIEDEDAAGKTADAENEDS